MVELVFVYALELEGGGRGLDLHCGGSILLMIGGLSASPLAYGNKLLLLFGVLVLAAAVIIS
jgi:hypothetical protein